MTIKYLTWKLSQADVDSIQDEIDGIIHCLENHTDYDEKQGIIRIGESILQLLDKLKK